jgi:nucleoid-associated protein YgaU
VLSEVKIEIDPVAQAKYEAELAAKKAAAERAKAEAEAAEAQAAREAAPQEPAPEAPRPKVNFEISGEGRPDIVAAAVAQVGIFQDCTDLVQNSLAAGGINATRAAGGWDFGTAVSEYTRFGGRIVTDGYLPGDVLVWENQHVAIYAGKGKIVHGGWGGNQTVINDVFSPNASPTVVRF